MSEHCDVCGKTDPGVTHLRQQYTTAMIRKLCPECMQVANDRLDYLHRRCAAAKERDIKNFLVAVKLRGPKSFLSRWSTTILRLLWL